MTYARLVIKIFGSASVSFYAASSALNGATSPEPKVVRRRSMPMWGWVAGGVGTKEPDAVTGPAVSESAAPQESADASPNAEAEAAGAAYLFNESDLSTPPARAVKEPAGWTREEVKDGMLRYRTTGLQCTFTTYQAALEPTGESGDEATTRW